MKEEDKEFLSNELDILMNKIFNSELYVQNFNFYSPFLKSLQYKKGKIHKQSRKCIFPSCNKMSIKNSHSIPKSMSLSIIASNGNLLHPDIDGKSNDLKMKMYSVGINNATVFPGYCIEHEKLFSSIENSNDINTENQVSLQAFRSLCREIVYRENELIILQNSINQYKEKIEINALEIFKKQLGNYPQFNNIDNFKIHGGDKIISAFEKMVNYINPSLILLKETTNSILLTLEDFQGENDINHVNASIDYILPISLCGYSIISYKEDDIKKEFLLVLNIIPTKDKTHILCSAKKEHKKVFDYYIKKYFQDESFMINGSDHWYISPDYWNKINIQKQEIILTDILQSKKDIWDEYPISIFDDIRNLFINIFLENTKNRKLTKFEEEFILHEKNKVNKEIYWKKMSNNELIEKIYKNFE